MVIAYVLILLLGAIVLFSLEKLSVDLITLLLLIGLIVPGIITPQEAFAGFSNDIIIILGSIFVISVALKDAGVLDWVGAQLLKFSHVSSRRFLFAMMGIVGGTSAFMNNTTVTALFTPLVAGMGRNGGVNASKLLMPVAFASILGGTCTLIGTSTNVAVSGFIQHAGMEPLGMFEITPIGLIILVTGIAYMMLVGVRLLPARAETGLTEGYAMRAYLSEVVVQPGSPLIGQMIKESDLAILEFQVMKIIRGALTIFPDPNTRLAEADRLIVTGKIENLIKVRKIEGIEIKADQKLEDRDLQGADTRLAEVLIGPNSEAAGRTLAEMDFRHKTGVTVIALYRHGRALAEEMEQVTLQVGDVLLVQGAASRFSLLQEDLGMPTLEELPSALLHPRRGFMVLGVFLAAVVCGSLGVLPLSACFLIAAVAVILLGAVNIERAYQFIDWRLLVLIGGMTAFGVAMEKTGTATFVSELIIGVFQPLGTIGILAGFFVLTIALTQPMSNAAAALVVLPIAIKTAEVLGSNPRTFAIGVMLAASISFVAPLEPSCILVYGPGRYRFLDFVKVGIGLTVVLTVVVLLLLPVFWPL